MILGFTGTREGMTPRQNQDLRWLLLALDFEEFHHGDCVGADAEAHDIVRAIYPQVKIVIHPAEGTDHRAFKKGDVILEPLPPLERNRDIVKASRRMIATPKEPREVLRSGTWATVRYSRQFSKPVDILVP